MEEGGKGEEMEGGEGREKFCGVTDFTETVHVSTRPVIFPVVFTAMLLSSFPRV